VQSVTAGWPDDPDTARLLRDCAAADIDWEVRRAAVQVLAAGWRDDPEIAAWLRARATADIHGNVRQDASRSWQYCASDGMAD